MTPAIQLTAWIVGLVTAGLIMYDMYAGIHHGTRATISWIIYQASISHPIIPFAAGLLCGHLFWSQRD